MKARVRRLLLVLAAAALLLDGGLLLAERLGAASLPEEDTAYFLDVGEGDCTLLVSGGSTVLVDAGTPEGAPALVRELKSLGVRRLDAVIATHPHADHIGGMEAVLRAAFAWVRKRRATRWMRRSAGADSRPSSRMTARRSR